MSGYRRRTVSSGDVFTTMREISTQRIKVSDFSPPEEILQCWLQAANAIPAPIMKKPTVILVIGLNSIL